MRKCFFSHVLAVILWPTAIIPAQIAAGSIEKQDLEKIFGDWELRQKRTKRVICKVEGTYLIPKGTYSGSPELPQDMRSNFPPQDWNIEVSRRWVINFEQNMGRVEERGKTIYLDKGTLIPVLEVKVFDGTVARTYTPRSENAAADPANPGVRPDLWEGADLQTFFNLQSLPIFLAHGTPPNRVPDPGALSTQLKRERFSFVRRAVHSGAECVVLRSQASSNSVPADELWVDTSRDSAIVKWVRYQGIQDVSSEGEIEYSNQQGGWWPAKWTFSIYLPKSKRPLQAFHFQVTQFELNPEVSSDEFRFTLQPGMIYARDMRKGEVYEVDKTGALTPIPQLSYVARGEVSPYWTRFVLIAVIVLGVIGIAVILLRRRKRLAEGA
jgi:hypothetical protein